MIKIIIGLTGLKGSGKDVVGAYLIKQHNFERRAFADLLKKSFAALFGIPPGEVEKMKNNLDAYITIGSLNEIVNQAVVVPHKQAPAISVRYALQRYGTEAHRDVFNQDIWVDALLPVGGFYAGRAIVVTDVRYQNEADRIKALQGYVVRISRPTFPTVDPHTSEAGQSELQVDYELNNDGSFSDLGKRIEEMLTTLSDET